MGSDSVRPEGLRLVLVGTGALGSALLRLLANSGVRSVLLIDPDTVEERNLPLSPFLQEAILAQSGCGKTSPGNKARMLAAHAREAFGLPWRALPCEVADAGWQELCAADLLCCCTDSALSRAELAFVARTLGKAVLDGAVFGDGIAAGRVTRFSAAAEAACYLCGLREDRRAAVLGYAGSAALGCRVPEAEAVMTGTLDTLQTIATAMMSAIGEFTQSGAILGKSFATRFKWPAQAALTGTDPGREQDTRTPGAPGWQREQVELSRSQGCPWHERVPSLAPLPWEQPLAQSLLAHTNKALYLAWPVCVEAACAACGARCAPFIRVGAVRRSMPCPYCGAVGLQPMRAVHRIRPADDLAQRSPRQLGQPRRHLYCLGPPAV